MCGIFGWVTPANSALTKGTLARLTNAMMHRGPDGAGYWLGGTHDSKHQIALGQRRLSLIDLVGGVQPMWSADGRIGLVVNGEIYNYVELREELRALGHTFRTTSDTEVLLEAYRAWGAEMLPRLRGMFALAIWDSLQQRLFLARDAFGKKPLFIAQKGHALAFGSEISPLLDFPGVERTLEPSALGLYLLSRYVPGPLTFFRDVRKLQPGTYMTWQAGQFEIRRHFTPPLARLEPDIERFDEAVEQFSQIFAESVRIRMRSDAPFGAYLSGGLDSSAVVAMMTRYSMGPVKTFSVGFREEVYSELHHARQVAGHFGTDHHEVVVDSDSFLEHWPLAVRRRGAPVSEASDIPILMLSQLASQSVKMVLTGEGADEIFGGYPKHRAEPWIGAYHGLVPQIVNDGLVRSIIRALPYGARRLKVLAAAAGERDTVGRLRIWFGGLSVAERDALLGRELCSTPPDAYPYSLKSGSALRRTLFFDQTSWLPDNLLERGDRMMMAGSIEGRMPFMDTELAALAARMPDRFLTGGPGGKTVLRAAVKPLLPTKITTRRKIGFRVPLGEWFRGEFRDLVGDMLLSDSSIVARLCDRRAVDTLVADHNSKRRNNQSVLWTLINLEMFLREYTIDGPQA